jgi:hypothetical protein
MMRFYSFFEERNKEGIFRTSPVPFNLEGAPPLPISPLLRRGEKLRFAETANLRGI